MAESNFGKAMFAVHQGTYVVKLIGEIRVPICSTLDAFIERMFTDRRLSSVLIDLSETSVIDSTALGLLAKIAVRTRKQFHQKPLIISTQDDVTRILDTMGFEKVFNIVYERPVRSPELTEIPKVPCDENSAFDKVLEAHRVLMDMNDNNRETFKDVVAALESRAAEPVTSEASRHQDSTTKLHRIN